MARVFETGSFRGKAAASQGTGGTGGGSVDDILKRLGVVESAVNAVAGDVREIKGILPSLATKAELESVRTEIKALESAIIKWIVGTTIAGALLSLSIAKFVHPSPDSVAAAEQRAAHEISEDSSQRRAAGTSGPS
jgi:hypothetical protein